MSFNGADFGILQLNIVAPTGSPVTTMPTTLATNTPWTGYTVSRNFNLLPDTMMSPVGQVEGPFNINGTHFDMGVINETVYLNDTEKWRITNNTGIAHPFHIHDVQFYLLNVNGNAVPPHERGQKDVVLVLPQQYVEFIAKFENFANDTIPYMYHCHMLHHEDEGMMGSFRVIDTTLLSLSPVDIETETSVFPNPFSDVLHINTPNLEKISVKIINVLGELVYSRDYITHHKIETSFLSTGIYFLQINSNKSQFTKKIIKE